MMGTEYPFIHFVSVVIVPFLLWIIAIELGIKHTEDNHFQASFGQVHLSCLHSCIERSDHDIGQVLAFFVTVPPLISCAKLVPRFGRWFVDLAWVRLVTRRPQRPFERLSDPDDDPRESGAIPLAASADGDVVSKYVAVSRRGSFESRRSSFDSMRKSPPVSR
jgi:hypothetical protein